MKISQLVWSHRESAFSRFALLTGGLLCISASVAAQVAAPTSGTANESSFWKRDTLLGDWGGSRSALKDKYGTEVTVNYIGETLSVLSGGLHRHATTRLFTVWFQQNMFDDRLSVRVGQLASDDEFFLSPTAGGLINATFGWTGMLGANIHSGGPAYPLSAPGARIAIKPTERLALLTAVFSGDPAGRNCNRDPPRLQPSRHHVQFQRWHAVDERTAIRRQSRQEGSGSAGHLQARGVVRECRLR